MKIFLNEGVDYVYFINHLGNFLERENLQLRNYRDLHYKRDTCLFYNELV